MKLSNSNKSVNGIFILSAIWSAVDIVVLILPVSILAIELEEIPAFKANAS